MIGTGSSLLFFRNFSEKFFRAVTTQANAGSLDCVRWAPHCARDDKGGVELRRALWIGSAAFGLNLLTRLTVTLDVLAGGMFLLLVQLFAGGSVVHLLNSAL